MKDFRTSAIARGASVNDAVLLTLSVPPVEKKEKANITIIYTISDGFFKDSGVLPYHSPLSDYATNSNLAESLISHLQYIQCVRI
jgi:hypothetical protein